MKIKVSKENDDIITKLVIDGVEKQFDYIRLINELYENEEIENIEFSDDIEEWEAEEIKKLVDEIIKATNTTEEDEDGDFIEADVTDDDELPF